MKSKSLLFLFICILTTVCIATFYVAMIENVSPSITNPLSLPSSADPRDGSSTHPLRLLFVTLEYKSGTFSGNGIYSQSMVRSLSKLGHSLFVISAAPDSLKDSHSAADVEAQLAEIPVRTWNRLDWKCSWREFADGISSQLALQVAEFQPDWALVVDWSSVPAYKQLASSHVWQKRGSAPPMAYLNYRVYTLSEYQGSDAEEEKRFYREKETEAVSMAGFVAGLSQRDADFLVDPHQLGALKGDGVQGYALLPPLREDIRQLALKQDITAENWPLGRRHLACCVRLSPEKNAGLFADLVESLAHFLREEGIDPVLCMGASGGGEYGAQVRDRVVQAVPSTVVINGFLGPDRMSQVYSQTLLNVHPCLYDAYGMTVVESAAFGAPSLVHVGPGGAVGATELLDPLGGFAIGVDMSLDMGQVSERVKEVLRDRKRLGRVGMAAAEKSLSWSEEANAMALTRMILRSGHRN